MSNLKTIIREPDPETDIITLDLQEDELLDSNGDVYNVELIVVGDRLRGLRFASGGEDLDLGSNSKSIMVTLRTASLDAFCTVYSLDASAPAAQINVTGSVFADGILTRANHIGVWGYKADVGHHCLDLNLWIAA